MPYDLKDEISKFRESCRSICIASLSPDGETIISYAPFVESSNDCYIYISEIAPHFASLRANPENIEIMFIQDESKANSIFARVRLRYRVKASFVDRESKEFDLIFNRFRERNGDSSELEILRNMGDFHLVRLKLGKGRFVKGFGKAYDIDGDCAISPANPKNPHRFE